MKLGWQRGWGGSRKSLPYLVLFLSLAVTLCAWVWAGEIVGSKDSERFTYAMEEADLAIKDRIADQVDLLRASAATFNLQKGWTRTQFHSYVESLQLGTNFRGSQGIGFIQRTSPDQVAKLESKLHAEGAPDFSVHPVAANREMYPVVYLEPQTSLNEPSIGYDAMSDPIRRDAMDSARDTGQPTISGPVAVPGGSSDKPQTGFLLYCPIYKSGQTPKTIRKRRDLLMGYVYCRFRGVDIFRDVLEGEPRHDLNIEIFDAEFGKPKIQFYRSSRFAPDRHALIEREGSTAVQGRQWLVKYHSSLAFEQQSAAWLVGWIPITGVIVSLLLGAVSFSQVRAYRQLNDKAAALIRSESNQRLLANVGARLVDEGPNEQNFHKVGELIVSEFADLFAVCIYPSTDGPPTFVCEANQFVKGYPGPDHCSPILLAWLLDHPAPIRFDLSQGPDPHLQQLQEWGLTGVSIVPVYDRLGSIGVVVTGKVRNGFDEDDLHLLVQIASRIAIAVDSERLVAEKERELEERRKAEEQARRLNENLEQIVEERTTELIATNKELEAFCYSVSHDLRAPLRSVDGFSKSLLEDYRDTLDDQARDYIARVRNASHRMDELITALLNLSRITRLEIVRQTIDITIMATRAVEDALEGQAADRFEVSVQAAMSVEADPKLVRVLLDNLIGNAVKFAAPSDRPRIEVGSRGSVFFVRDNGVGFNPAYSDKLFVAFERLHSQHEFPGSGIGLATVQRIVQRHGGTVWADSAEGKGATFYFTLR